MSKPRQRSLLFSATRSLGSNRVRHLASRVSEISRSNWALGVFLFAPFLSIISAPFFLIGFDRFGVQWHVLLLSCLVAAVLVVPQTGFVPFLRKLLAFRAVAFAVAAFLIWLVCMGLVHGFVAQLESLSSALMLLLMLPVAVYAVAENEHRDWLIGAAVVVMSVIVVLENAFLTHYLINGKGFNLVYLNMLGPPKLFFNVRDGNFLALVQFQALICWILTFFQRGWNQWNQRFGLFLFSVASFVAFYNAWLTAGRGFLLSLGFSLLLLATFAYRRGDQLLGQLTLASFLSGGLAWLTNMGLRLAFASVSVSGRARDAALIERADGGRFEIWGTWLNSGLTQSPLWGHGLGYLPETGTNGNHTPHNLLIQLVADAGLSGVLMAALLSIVAFLACRQIRTELLLLMALPTFPVLCYLQFGSVLFWPAGVWSFFILILCILVLICFQVEFPFCDFDGADQAEPIPSFFSGRVTAFSVLFILCLLVTALSGAKYLFFDL
ncbi:putative conserved membrane protein [Synechococcus sp. A15-127]|uniref:hypothetical protein n=1 Tax=Synechococcus sp. A15-127 TaxID=1050624 RepID=UPI001644C59E|nr:hypothetical protein [Synechococcus sp. A15-127]QNI93963.1 putative conserved membrane protein [Synechococcus sp. A15-127]